MNEFSKVLLNARSLRAATKELSLEQLEEVLVKLNTIIEERQETAAQALAEQKEREEKLSEIVAQLKESGIEPAELINLISNDTKKVKSKRQPRPPKYAYEEDGVKKTWTGQGRMPSVLKNALDETGSIEQYLI